MKTLPQPCGISVFHLFTISVWNPFTFFIEKKRDVLKIFFLSTSPVRLRRVQSLLAAKCYIAAAPAAALRCTHAGSALFADSCRQLVAHFLLALLAVLPLLDG